MRKLSKCRYLCFGLIMVALVFCTVAYQTSVAGEVQPTGAASIFSPLKIVDAIPQPAAGIQNSIRVYDDTSFAVLIESEYGINLANPASIRFQIDDGEYTPYTRDLSSSAVRVIEVENYSTAATLI